MLPRYDDHGQAVRSLSDHTSLRENAARPRRSGRGEAEGKGRLLLRGLHGPLFKKKTIAVVGSADQAVEATLLLSDLAEKVYLSFPREMLLTEEESVE